MGPLYLSFLWHMHQPYYKNLYTGDYLLPWVLLHGTKDYFDMAAMLKGFDGLKQNFNVVPSLLLQLADYENLGAKDTYLEVFKKQPKDLTDDDKIFIITNFFNANWDNMIKPHPRFYELLNRRGFYCPRDSIDKIKDYFNDEDFRDIQILFFLAWIDPSFYDQYDSLQYLKKKGRAFSEEDKGILEEVQKKILQGIIPLYRELASAGIIEVSTSPFYHPIIPLLIDCRIARESIPNAALPERLFAKPEDASSQIEKAIRLFRELFGDAPGGMWPPEGSVSDDALRLYIEHGVQWLATDEDILFQSLKSDARRDGSGFLTSPELLYKPYRYEHNGGHIDMIFRDQSLSDLISFHYSRMDAKDAANDCLRRIKRIGDSVKGRIKRPLVTIAMDGENAWEGYKNDGRDFFNYLYEGILKEKDIVPVTISEYLREAEDMAGFSRCFAGSWIGHNFSIWIGHVEDNAGWSLLSETRDFLEGADPDKKNKDAWESIYIAEGSDWFWWYGDEHSSENDEIFDLLFRENLANVYRFLGKEPPEILSIPIIIEDREARPAREPINFIRPIIDGKVTNYFEWIGSGFFEGKGHGTAMHEAVTLIKGCHYGFNAASLFLRIDVDHAFMADAADVSFEINLMAKENFKIVYFIKDGRLDTALPVSAMFADIMEVEVPFSALGVEKNETIDVWFTLKTNDMFVDRIPKRGYISIKVPSENFEMEMWYV